MATTWGQTILKTPAVSRECFGKDLEHRSPTSSNAAWDPFRGLAPPDRCPFVLADGAARGVLYGRPHPLQEAEVLERLKGRLNVLVLELGVLGRKRSELLGRRHAKPPRAKLQSLGLPCVERFLCGLCTPS